MSLQVPGVLLPEGPGVLPGLLHAAQAGAVGDEGSHPDIQGSGGSQPGAQEIQGRADGDDRRRLGQRSVLGGESCENLAYFLCVIISNRTNFVAFPSSVLNSCRRRTDG